MQSQPHTHSLHNDSEVGDSTIPCTRRQNLNIIDIQHRSQKELSSKQTLDFGINKGNGDGSAGMLSHAHLKFLQSSGTRILCRRLAGDCLSRIRNTVAGEACCAPPPAPAPPPPPPTETPTSASPAPEPPSTSIASAATPAAIPASAALAPPPSAAAASSWPPPCCCGGGG